MQQQRQQQQQLLTIYPNRKTVEKKSKLSPSGSKARIVERADGSVFEEITDADVNCARISFGALAMLHGLISAVLSVCYIRHLSYCFYITVNRICVAMSRVDGAFKPWSAIHLGVGNSKQKPGFACSSYV